MHIKPYYGLTPIAVFSCNKTVVNRQLTELSGRDHCLLLHFIQVNFECDEFIMNIGFQNLSAFSLEKYCGILDNKSAIFA